VPVAPSILRIMGKSYERIEPRLQEFIEDQKVFFVATAPLTGDGHVNLSPKGRAGTLRILDDRTVAYLDFGGSHAETIAHLRENGRITLMWCAFEGPPNIVRIHGRGEPVFRDDPRFPELVAGFGEADGPALRAVVVASGCVAVIAGPPCWCGSWRGRWWGPRA
jgi:predicted pyridoxine 5'-phosphate oxidase superfamily flavin-nucleotide-binding protein